MGRRKKKEIEAEEIVEDVVQVEPVAEEPEVVEEPEVSDEVEPEVQEEPKVEAPKKPKANKFNAAINPGQERRIQAETIKKRPAVSVENMIEENKAATVSTDYQQYLRRLMKQAGGRA